MTKNTMHGLICDLERISKPLVRVVIQEGKELGRRAANLYEATKYTTSREGTRELLERLLSTLHATTNGTARAGKAVWSVIPKDLGSSIKGLGDYLAYKGFITVNQFANLCESLQKLHQTGYRKTFETLVDELRYQYGQAEFDNVFNQTLRKFTGQVVQFSVSGIVPQALKDDSAFAELLKAVKSLGLEESEQERALRLLGRKRQEIGSIDRIDLEPGLTNIHTRDLINLLDRLSLLDQQ